MVGGSLTDALGDLPDDLRAHGRMYCKHEAARSGRTENEVALQDSTGLLSLATSHPKRFKTAVDGFTATAKSGIRSTGLKYLGGIVRRTQDDEPGAADAKGRTSGGVAKAHRRHQESAESRPETADDIGYGNAVQAYEAKHGPGSMKLADDADTSGEFGAAFWTDWVEPAIARAKGAA